MTQIQSKQYPYLNQPSLSSSESLTGNQTQLRKIINNEFRNLQLDQDIHRKSLFDLIDHCEWLFEKSYEPNGLYSYTKGYLVFNYFINTFVMLNYGGFDKFIELSKDDFIIYLNIYNFYNTNDEIMSDRFKINAHQLKAEILNYLMDKKLLTYDVDELYTWLNKYIEYLKEKDGELCSEATTNPKNSYNPNDSSDSFQSEQSSYKDNNLKFNNDYQPMEYKLYQNGNSSAHSFDNFKTRYPSINSQKTFIPTSPTPPLPPLHSNPLPPLPNGVKKVSSDITNQNAETYTIKKSYTQTPYPLQDKQDDFSINSHVPYPIESTEMDDNIAKRLNGIYITPKSYNQPPHAPAKTTPMAVPNHIHATYNGHYGNHGQNGVGHNSANGTSHHVPNNITYQSNNPYNPSINSSHSTSSIQFSNKSPQILTSNSSYQSVVVPPIPKQNQYSRNQQPPPPLPASTQVMMNSPLPVCRLRNLGSSCYINSTIQLLFGLQELISIFTTSSYHRLIKNPKYLKLLHNSQTNHHDSLLLSDAISGLLVAFSKFNGSAIAPKKFIRVSSVLKPDFNIPNEQQDAQEFLLFVLERLHDELSEKMELSDASSGPILEDYICKWNIEVNPKDKPEYLKWYRTILESEGKSPIHDIFQGHLQSKLICNKCGHESISYSPFTSLSLPIPSSNTQYVNLSDCLRYYTQDEVLSGENAWNCPKCSNEPHISVLESHPVFANKKSGLFKLGKRSKSPTKDQKSKPKSSKNYSTTTKSLTFIKLPQVLLIHLARFSIYNLTDKLDTPIQYPLELKFNNNSHEIRYKLTGIINHYGNLKSGHYTALVNKSTMNFGSSTDNLVNPFWCFFDDDVCKPNVYHGNITQPGMDHLSSRDVYVLCYERI